MLHCGKESTVEGMAQRKIYGDMRKNSKEGRWDVLKQNLK
jgi:hypothetical protein